ncbi:TolC family protein [Pleurocapsa sp. FMAR1]|uniref:TolC family protein n=1 Tax=Pleurocapsa sp. FMAR1 TaxID=3040204 RepID=UPI0029C6D3D0|nr:TolC family protein [Pleurocapsa sp. FMAR1]
MNYKEKFLCAFGVYSAILFGNNTSATAENIPTNIKVKQPERSHSGVTRLKTNLTTPLLPNSQQFATGDTQRFLTASQWDFLLNNKLSQSTQLPEQKDSEPMPSILNQGEFSTNADDLRLAPTQPNQVTTDLGQLITIEQDATITTAENIPTDTEAKQPERSPSNEKGLKTALATPFLPNSQQFAINDPQRFLTATQWDFLPANNKLSQLTPLSEQGDSKSNLPAMLNLGAFGDSSDNPLLLPTQPKQVTIDLEKPITIKQAVSVAINRNQDIEISRLNVNTALEQLQEAKAARFPTLSASTGFDNVRPAAAIGGASTVGGTGTLGSTGVINQSQASDISTTTNTFSSSLSLNYDIYTGGSIGATIGSAEKQVRVNQLALQQTIEETTLLVATNYYDLQAANAQVDIEKAAVEDAQQTLNDADVLQRAGTGTKFEVLQAKVALADAKQLLNIEQANQVIAQRTLADTLNIGQRVELKTADAIEVAGSWKPSLPKTIVMAYKNRAELKQFLLDREINRDLRQVALAENRPQVSLVASYDLQDQLDDNTDLADGYSVGASVLWNFFDGGAARSRARQAATDIEINNAEFANQRDAVRLEVENAYYTLNANQENIGTAGQSVELATESLRLARLRFQAGAGTQTEVIDAQASLTTARGNLLTAIIDYNQSYAQLQRAVSNLPT